MPDTPNIPAKTGDAKIMKQGHTTAPKHGASVSDKANNSSSDLSISTTGRK